MANEPRKPSWKNPTGGGKNPAPARKRDWQASAAAPKKPAKSRRGRLIITAVIGAVLIAALVIYLKMLSPPRYPLMVVVGPPNAATFSAPENVAGYKAAKDLEDWAGKGSDRPRLAGPPITETKEGELNLGLNDVKEEGVVVYLTAPGGADRDGPFLWMTPSDASAPSPKQKLRVKSILNDLAKLPSTKHKLLVFDATQNGPDWARGELRNDFARGLRKLDSDIAKIDNLVVVCASDEDDERSWVAEEWGQSVFAHFWLRGLSGGLTGDRLTAADVFKHVQGEVSAWVQVNRDATQKPFLLPGDSGMQRAREMLLASVKDARPEDKPADYSPDAELQKAWEFRESHETQLPPEFIAPEVWRRYLDGLLRAEVMHRHGYNTSDFLQKKVRPLEAALAGNQWLAQDSLGAAWPMPDALGIPRRRQPLTDAQFDELWRAEDAARRSEVWLRLRDSAESTPTVGVTLLRLELAARMLDALDSRLDPDRGNIVRAAEVLDTAFGTTPVPTEVQLLQLLNKKELRSDDTAKRAGPEFVRAALRTRRKAEVVAVAAGFTPPAAGDSARQSLYPAGEFVFPWIAGDLAEADRTRLEGEDLLFSSRPDDWPLAGRKFQQAGEAYSKIGERAVALRSAYRTRNQVLAELPYYARWVAGLRAPFTRDQVTKLLADVEAIARSTHELAGLLDDGDPNTLAKIEDARKLAADGFQTLTNTFFTFATTTDFTATNQSNWHAIDNLLQVPFVPAAVRARRLKELRSISTALLAKPRSADTASGSGKASVSVQQMAQRQGRMALAVLGSRRVEEQRSQSSERRADFQALRSQIDDSGPEWWNRLQYEAGEQIGWHWQRLREEIEELTTVARTQSIGEMEKGLRRADWLARSLDSATALASGSRPAGAYRELRLHYFLLGQASRALDAGWASAAADPQPYAEKVATWFVQDAEKLLVPADAEQIERNRLLAAAMLVRQRLRQSAKFSVQPTDPTRLITESTRMTADFVLTPPPGHHTGIPVWRGRASAPLRLAVSADGDFKTITDFATPKPPVDVHRELAADILVKSGDSNAGGQVALELVYRGHLITKPTDVAVNSKHSALWAYNPPEGKAAFAVVAKSDVRPGTVMIILDTSTSMILDDFGKPIDKFKNALDALQKVLNDLPPRTNVGLVRFSGRRGISDSAIELVRDVAVHEFQSKPEQLKSLIDKLRADSCNATITPLARAIKQVMEGPFLKQGTGFKTLLVLTDGEDNVDGNRAFKVVQDAMGTEDVSLQMVLFDAGKEEQAAIDQFERIRDLPTPGRLWHTANKDTLVSYLRNAMQPHIRVYRNNNQTLEPSIHKNGGRGVRVPAPGDNLEGWSPGLEPGLYYLRAFGENPSKVDLEPGDRLFLELRTQNGLLKMVPYRYTQEVANRAPTRVEPEQHPGRNGVRLAVPRCVLVDRRDGKGTLDLELTVMMDRYSDEIDIARMDRPVFAWFEVRTRDQKLDLPPRTVNIENLHRFPAPTWKLQVPAWPASKGEVNVEQYPAVPVVSAWWLDTLPAPAGRLPRDVKIPFLPQDTGLQNRTIGVEGDEVTIESVRIENHTLIVQARHAKNRPIFIWANGLVGRPDFDLKQAHFFYDEVGRYTAKFGPVETLTEKTPFTLEVHSLKRLKDEVHGLTLNLNMLPKQNDTAFSLKPVDLK